MSKSTTTAVQAYVEKQIADSPFQHLGVNWCAASQAEMAEEIGVSISTLRRTISRPPFTRLQKLVGGKKLTLVRIGEPLPMTSRHVANTLSKIWREFIERSHAGWTAEIEQLQSDLPQMVKEEHTRAKRRIKKLRTLLSREARTTRREYGCMNGLVKDWADGHQAELFKFVLRNWTDYIAWVKCASWVEADSDGKKEFTRFLEFPAVSVIRRYHYVALDLIEADFQEKGTFPEWIRAINPHLWTHLGAN